MAKRKNQPKYTVKGNITNQVKEPVEGLFIQVLETSRAYFDHMKVPLWKTMKHLRSGDTMTSSAEPADPNDPLARYGWKEIYIEFCNYLGRPLQNWQKPRN